MADKFAEVVDPAYTVRGVRVGRGRIVRLTADQLKQTKDHEPPRLKEVNANEEQQATAFDMRPKALARALQAPESGEAPERESLKKK